MAVLSLAFVCVRLLPGVASDPIYRLIWREHDHSLRAPSA
jgi:hypothetical protein